MTSWCCFYFCLYTHHLMCKGTAIMTGVDNMQWLQIPGEDTVTSAGASGRIRERMWQKSFKFRFSPPNFNIVIWWPYRKSVVRDLNPKRQTEYGKLNYCKSSFLISVRQKWKNERLLWSVGRSRLILERKRDKTCHASSWTLFWLFYGKLFYSSANWWKSATPQQCV